MERILHIETATKVCSVALAQRGELLAWRTIQDEGFLHGEKLHVLAEEVLHEAGFGWSSIDAIAVSMGPGSYTGLRIGVSSVKGWCYALNIPMIAVSTLRAMAFGVLNSLLNTPNVYVVPMIDARRMEVYTAVYDGVAREIIAPHALVIEEGSFLELLSTQKVVFCGDGAAKCMQLIHHPNAHFSDILPDARWMVSPALELYCLNSFVNLAYFEPEYLKGANITTAKS